MNYLIVAVAHRNLTNTMGTVFESSTAHAALCKHLKELGMSDEQAQKDAATLKETSDGMFVSDLFDDGFYLIIPINPLAKMIIQSTIVET